MVRPLPWLVLVLVLVRVRVRVRVLVLVLMLQRRLLEMGHVWVRVGLLRIARLVWRHSVHAGLVRRVARLRSVVCVGRLRHRWHVGRIHARRHGPGRRRMWGVVALC